MNEQTILCQSFSIKLFNIIFLAFLIPNVSYAYVDPGSGSLLVTTILGLIAAVGYTTRKYFYKIKRTLFGQKTEIKEEKED